MGAARFLRGLLPLLDPRDLTVVVNTGDDENFFGLHVSPDLDTITYTLAGRVHRGQGWGLAGDTFHCLRALRELYGEAWFGLGDRDLATHIFRTDALRRGRSLTAVTADIAHRLGVRVRILPMSDDEVRTFVHVTGQGPLPFQDYLVRRGARGRVEAIRFRHGRRARPAPGVLQAIRTADLLVLPPSNPFVSIAPILAIPGVRETVAGRRKPTVAVTPIVRGMPIKGPLHRMLRGLGHEVSAAAVAALYRGLADVFVLDRRDERLARRIHALGMHVAVTDTIMRTEERSRELARTVLGLATAEKWRSVTQRAGGMRTMGPGDSGR